MDRMSAASRLLGYNHSHRDLVRCGRDDYSADNHGFAVVWGRSCRAIHVDSAGGVGNIMDIGITIFDTDRTSPREHTYDEIVYVYGERIMHKKCDTTCPDRALSTIMASRGYLFVEWTAQTPRIECE